MQYPRYSLTTQSLHWAVALAVVAAYVLGLYREAVPKGDFRVMITGLHMSLGVLVFGLSIIRIGIRPFAASLPATAGPRWMHLAAKAGHLTLYALLIAVPLVGMLMVWAKGRPVMFFGTSLMSPISVSGSLAKPMEEVHEVTAHLMMIMAGLHATAAIIHHSVLRDGTLTRMVPKLSLRG